MWFDDEILDDLDDELTKENMIKKYKYKIDGELTVMATTKKEADEKLITFMKHSPTYVSEATFIHSEEIVDGKFTQVQEEE
jgi:hypothetical protein|tara:strand:+ start:234 stop:476 length:243 start_codon:yes stop_codon:yes gene_type:complete